MHARVSTLSGPPELVADELAVIRDTVIPTFAGRSGFRGIIGLVEPERRQSIVMSLWAREEDMHATDEEARTLRDATAEAGEDQILSVKRYEVAIFEIR